MFWTILCFKSLPILYLPFNKVVLFIKCVLLVTFNLFIYFPYLSAKAAITMESIPPENKMATLLLSWQWGSPSSSLSSCFIWEKICTLLKLWHPWLDVMVTVCCFKSCLELSVRLSSVDCGDSTPLMFSVFLDCFWKFVLFLDGDLTAVTSCLGRLKTLFLTEFLRTSISPVTALISSHSTAVTDAEPSLNFISRLMSKT